MEPMPLPDIAYQTITLPAGTNPDLAVPALLLLPGCEPRPNTLGNLQTVVRLDYLETGELVCRVPETVDPASVLQAVAAAAA